MKLKENEIEKLKEFQQKSSQLSFEIGELTRQQWNIKTMLQKGKELIEDLSKEQESFLKDIESEYGKGSIDMETFEFTPQEA